MSKRKSPAQVDEASGYQNDQTDPLAKPDQRQQNSRSVDEFVHVIRAAWRKGVDSILETGDLLRQAKDELPFGAWEEMCATRLPFDKSSVERLMAIARDPVLSNPALGPLLPPHWRTLYELTKVDKKLGERTLAAKLQDGTINAATQRPQVAELLRGGKPPAKRATPLQAARDKIAQQAAHIEELEAAREEPPLTAVEQDPEPLDALREANHALKTQLLASQAEAEDLRREKEELQRKNAELQARLEVSETTEDAQEETAQ